jgi:hypothetical protein
MTEVRRIQLLVVAVISAWLAWRAHTGPDYIIDAGPPIDALIHGRIHDFLSARPAMGPFSLVLRAPFAALSRLTDSGGPAHNFDADYRFGVFPCVFAAGLLGMALADILKRGGRSTVEQWLALLLCMVNPVSARALALGHPEEILGGTLLAAGLLAAIAGYSARMTVSLALALLTKQWALFGLLPAAIVLGWQRLRRPLAVGGLICLAVVVPVLVADPGTLLDANVAQLDIKYEAVQPASIWWPFTEPVYIPGRTGYHALPDYLRYGARPLILAVGLLLPLVFARRVRESVRTRALPLLALVLLVRCFLDPVNNGYYHVPFFLALLAADALAGSILPALVAAAGLEAITLVARTNGLDPAIICAAYLAWALPFAIYLAGRTWGLDWAALLRTRVARGRTAERTLRPS